jgi:hypothetical protein
LAITATVAGTPLPAASVAASEFELLFPLPDALVGKPEIPVVIEVNRAAKPASDPRELGLAFGEISVK